VPDERHILRVVSGRLSGASAAVPLRAEVDHVETSWLPSDGDFLIRSE
jgi:hypothetical protein